MTRTTILGVCLCVLMPISGLLTAASAEDKSDTKVKVSAVATRIDKAGKQTVTITIDVAKDWYIYANPVGNDNFADNRTSVAISAKQKIKVDVNYPSGKVKTEGKTTVKIYEPSVVITAEVQRTAGDVGPLEVRIDVNACRKKDGKTVECLLPGTVKVVLP